VSSEWRRVVASLVALAGAGQLLTGPAPAAAQAPARILGRVVDSLSRSPVADAEIMVEELRAVSDAEGDFALGNVSPGRVELRLRALGYAPGRATVDVVPGLDRMLTVSLTPLAVRLDSILVAPAPGAIAIDGAALERRGGDLARALDGWEGVVVRRAGNGPAAPQMRGGGPDEVLVVVDGFPVNDPLTGRADLSRIASREVEGVTLLPGAQTVRAGGRAIAGVIVVETRRSVAPEGAAWGGSHGAWGGRAGASLGALTVSASGETLAEDFGYQVPEVRGGGEATRRNAGGTQYSAAVTIAGPVEAVARGTLVDRGLPGTTTNPTPAARAADRSLLLGVRTTSRLALGGSLQWLEARAADPAPPTGPGYDSYGHGVGGTVSAGYAIPLTLRAWAGSVKLTGEGRGDRFSGDGIRRDASFTGTALRAEARLGRTRGASTWSLSPAARLDAWTRSTTPRASARVDAGWQQGRTSVTLAVGSGVTPPVLADLFFREGVGVRINPDLRPERVRWEVEAGVRRELPSGGHFGLRLFAGRVADMIIWAPDFRFIWSPRNFDVVRRGGELTLAWRPWPALRLSGGATYSAVTYDIPGGAQVQYRPRVTYDAAGVWSAGPWSADLRWHRIGQRFPNSAGTNPRPAFALVDAGLERRLGDTFVLRGDVHDLADRRAEFLAGYPTPGRSVLLTLTVVVP
jgi:vitamin B12 transporter